MPISPKLLQALREYWRLFRPRTWLFAHGNYPDEPLSVTTCQRVFQHAKAKAGITKVGGIHGLRHYADSRIMPSSKRKLGDSAVLKASHSA